MNKYDTAEIAFKNGYKRGAENAATRILEEAEQLIDDTNGECIYKEALVTIVEGYLSEVYNNDDN